MSYRKKTEGDISWEDGNKEASTYDAELKLSESSAEWDDLETAVGEKSLVASITQAAQPSGDYLLRDGSKPMAGPLELNKNVIRDATTIKAEAIQFDTLVGQNQSINDSFSTELGTTENGYTLFGSPTFDDGMELDGSTQYATKAATGLFNSSEITIAVEFTPDFDYTEDEYRRIFDTSIASRYYVYKRANVDNNSIDIALNNVVVGSIDGSIYGVYWKQSERNILIITGDGSSTSVELNGVQILTSAVVWTPGDPTDLFIGTRELLGAYFDGTIHSLKVFKSVLPLAAPAHSEGLIFWNHDGHCPSYYNENDETQICIGQEEVTRVYNDTGVDIANGKPVYINGADSGWPTVELASSKTFDESRIIGLATSLIPDGGFGYVTERGPANDIDTSLYAEGTVIFLGETPGDLTDVRPTNGLFPVIIGIVTISHVSAGRISVFTNVSQYTAETVQALGWADTNQYTASFDNGTRTLTVTPVATEFRWYQSGIKYEEATDSLVIADTEGLRIIYYDEGTITELVKPSEGQISAIVRTNPTVVYVYWDATNQLCTYLGNEQHTIGYPADVHVEMHFTRGAQYLSGLGMTDIVSEATGDLDAHAQFGVESGLTEEEGVLTILAVRSSTEGLPIYHLSGIEADPDVRQIINAGFSVTTTGTGRLAWNELTGGSWQLTEVTNNQYVLCHVFALNDFVDSRKQIAFIGQTDYASVSAARLGADEEIKNIRTAGITSPELVPLATFVLQTSNTYGNAVQARVREIETGVDYVDWRQTELVGGGGTGAVNPQFSDALFRLFDDADATKQTAFQVSGVTAGTTRTLTVQDADGTIALTGDAPATHGSTHENGSADEINVGSLSGELADSQKTTVRKNTGSNVGTRRRLNLIEGTNVTLTVADDAANEEIDITIASSGGAGGGDVSGPGVSTDDAITRWDGTNGQLIQNSVVTMDDAGNINGAGTINSVNVADHNARHENGGADEMDVTDLSGLLADGQTPISHNASHEDAGADEIDVSNLSGELADPQKLTVRKNSGANVGSRPRLNLIEGSNITLTVADDGPGDEVDITIAGLGGSGDVTGPASSVDSELTLFNSTTGKLIKGGTGVAVDGSGNLTGVGTVNSVTVENHKSRHENGGADEISVADLSGLLADGQTPLGHNTSHANGGGDEIDLTGMSGLLGTAQTPVSHASSHQNGGGDQISVAGLTGLLGTPQTPAAHTQTASTITDFDAEVSNNASVVANTAKVSNATHTGDVTGSTALTIADGKVTYAKIQNVLANNVLLGNNSGAGSIVEELTGSEAKTLIGLGDVTNDAQVKKEASVTDGRIAIWDGTTGDALKDTGDAEIDGDLTLTGNLTATGAPIVELAGSATLTYASHYGRWLKVGGTGVRTLTIDATFHALATKDLEMHIQNLSSTAIDVIQISTPGGTTLSGVGNRLDVSAEDVATLKLVDDDEYFIFGGTE